MTAEYAHRKSLIEQRITARTEYIKDSSKISDEKLKDALISNYHQAQLESLQAFLESPSKVLMKNKNEMKIKDITEIIKEIGEMQKSLRNSDKN